MTKFDFKVIDMIVKDDLLKKNINENLEALNALRDLVGPDAEITFF